MENGNSSSSDSSDTQWHLSYAGDCDFSALDLLLSNIWSTQDKLSQDVGLVEKGSQLTKRESFCNQDKNLSDKFDSSVPVDPSIYRSEQLACNGPKNDLGEDIPLEKIRRGESKEDENEVQILNKALSSNFSREHSIKVGYPGNIIEEIQPTERQENVWKNLENNTSDKLDHTFPIKSVSCRSKQLACNDPKNDLGENIPLEKIRRGESKEDASEFGKLKQVLSSNFSREHSIKVGYPGNIVGEIQPTERQENVWKNPENNTSYKLDQKAPIKSPIRIPKQLECYSHKNYLNKDIPVKKIIRGESKDDANEDEKLNLTHSPNFPREQSMKNGCPDNIVGGHQLTQRKDMSNNNYPKLHCQLWNSSNSNNFSNEFKGPYLVSQEIAKSHLPLRGECSKKFSTLRKLPSEQSRDLQPKYVFICRKCERKFPKVLAFISHMRKHDEPISFKCDQCSKEFIYRSKLKEHYVVHRKEKPFKCDYCAFASKWKNDVKKHIKRCHQSQFMSVFSEQQII